MTNNIATNLSMELFNNKLIFISNEQVNILIKKILKAKVVNNLKRSIYYDFLSLENNYSERLTIVANKYYKSVNEITEIINTINKKIINSNYIIYLLCLTNQPFFNQIPIEEQDILYKYKFHIAQNQTWPIILDDDINNIYNNLINYLKRLETNPNRWAKLVLNSFNNYEKKIFNHLLSTKYCEISTPKKQQDFATIYQKSDIVIKNYEVYNTFYKIIHSQVTINKIYYYFSKEDLANFEYFYHNLNILVIKPLSKTKYQILSDIINKIKQVKEKENPPYSFIKLLQKIQSANVHDRENFFKSLKPNQLNIIKKATRLFNQKLDIMKNLNHEEKITYVLLIRKVDEELVKIKRNNIKLIYPNQLLSFYDGQYKLIEIEKSLNLLNKKEYQLLSIYLSNIDNTEIDEEINNIIYIKIPHLISTIKQDTKSKDKYEIIKMQLDFLQKNYGNYNLEVFNEIIDRLNKKDQALFLKYICNQMLSPQSNYFTSSEANYFNNQLLPEFKNMLEESERKSPIKINDFKDYTIQELKEGISMLSPKEQNIIYLKYGHNLDNQGTQELNPNEIRIYQNIVRKNLNKILIQNRLLKNNKKILYNLINNYEDLQLLKKHGIKDINILIYAINLDLINNEDLTINKIKDELKITDEIISYIINECNTIITTKTKKLTKK